MSVLYFQLTLILCCFSPFGCLKDKPEIDDDIFFRPFARLRWLRVLEEGNCVAASNTNHKHLSLYMDRHLRSVAIMIEVTNRHMECTHFNLDYSQMSAIAQQLKPREEATSSPMKLDGSVFSQAAQTIVESPSFNVKTVFQLKSWREPRLLRPANLTVSTLAGKACCDLSNFLPFYARLL